MIDADTSVSGRVGGLVGFLFGAWQRRQRGERASEVAALVFLGLAVVGARFLA
jgi:hypothetical protein